MEFRNIILWAAIRNQNISRKWQKNIKTIWKELNKERDNKNQKKRKR